MSAAKHRMRSRKMRNQPSSVTYTSPGWDSSQGRWRNGEETPFSGQKHEHAMRARGHHPPTSDAGGQCTDWVRGHPAGGAIQALPRFITASTFAMARAAEVNAMMKAVTKTMGSCHVFGGLPKHMRRRAMSHNMKRLPRRLREGAQKMMEKSRQAGQKEKKDLSKRKSRKARRRHGNLLLEFNRRQRKNVWLETHIWHAKRFHMVKRWGYCLGDRPTYKCYRACYRAMSQHCLLQDLSYYCCVELQGPEEVLLAALSRLTSKETGPTFAAAHFLSGRRQGSAVLYRADRYPAAPLGPVLFLWRPKSEASTLRQLWIWSHPTLKQDLLPELQAACQCSEPLAPPVPVPVAPPAPDPDLAQTLEVPDEKQPPGKKRKRAGGHPESDIPAKKILGDGTRFQSAPTSWRCALTGVILSDLTMELVRYRLIGPLSHMILMDTLTPASACQTSDGTETSGFWWPAHCREESNMSLHQRQTETFQLLRGVPSTADVPGGSVLGLTVDDPRLTLPSRRCKATPDGCSLPGDAEGGDQEDKQRALMLQGFPVQCSQSSLWDRSVRDNVTDNKISEQELNRMKSELLVPGSRLQATPRQGRIPVLLLQQPGKQMGTEMASWGAGWDLLLPKGWGMAFWVPLVYRGVRVGGQQEALKHSQNKGGPHFPHDFPDCPAGARFVQEQEAELRETYKRRPPAKRPNFIKHGTLAPFLCPWQQLVEEWKVIVGEGSGMPSVPPSGVPAPQPQEATSCADDALRPERGFTVLRNRKALQQLSSLCRPISSRGQRSQRPGRPQKADQPFQLFAASLSALHYRSLVWVRLSQLRKGRPVLHAMICVPTPEDFALLRQDPTCCGPQEPRHVDHFKSCIKRRKKTKTDSSPSNTLGKSLVLTVGRDTDSTSNLTVGQDTDNASSLTVGLWPNPLPSVTSHCSRVTLGWTTQGDFSLSAGCGEALGFISLMGLLHMLPGQPEDLRGLVLLRNPASLQYRFAKITIEA